MQEILSSAMQATISKIKEVELQQENAKLSWEEAAKADEKLIEMVEGLDNVIKTAKETNDEVYFQTSELFFLSFPASWFVNTLLDILLFIFVLVIYRGPIDTENTYF